MTRLILRSLTARKGRLITSSLAVVLGVAFVAGSLVLGDTLNRAFDGFVGEANAGTAAIVRNRADGEPVPQRAADIVRNVDGVAAAEGAVSGFARVRPRSGNDTPSLTPGTAVSWIDDPALNPLRLTAGRAPRRAGEVVVDPSTAATLGLRVGNPVTVVTLGRSFEATLVGLAGMGGDASGITTLALARSAAQQAFGQPGGYSSIRVRGEPGLSDPEVRDRVARALAAAGSLATRTGDPVTVEVVTGAQATREALDEIREGTAVFTNVLLVFAGIALFVGAFLIVNTFTMLAAQRTRELAALRALGASRGQVLRLVVAEALLVGTVAGSAGLAAGIGLAAAVRAAVDAAGLDLPAGDLVVSPRTVLIGLLLGPLVTAVAALLPARRAARTAPVAAMRDSVPTPVRVRRRAVAAATATAAAAATLGAGVAVGDVTITGIGAGLALLAAISAGPLLVVPATRALTAPAVRLGAIVARLARDNVVANSRRSAATAGALMVGIALVSGVVVLGASVKAHLGTDIAEVTRADLVVKGEFDLPFAPDAETAIAARPEVAVVAGVRGAQADVGGTSTWLAGIDPRTLSEVLALPMADGTTEDLRSGRIFVSDTTGLRPGDEVRVGFSRTGERRFTVAGVYRSTSVIGDYLLTTADVDRNVTAPTDLTVLVTVAPGRTVAEAERAVDAALQNFPLVRADTVAEFANARRGTVDQAVNTVTALLALSLLIALLGVANTLSLSVIERTREIGLLRAVGMLRRQLRRTIRLEAAVIAAYGALLGAALGVTLGIAVSTVLLDRAAPALPVAGITTVVVGAALTAVVAAALPARRAARLPLLDAIHTT